jgi:uncharacterized membrane protein YhdT
MKCLITLNIVESTKNANWLFLKNITYLSKWPFSAQVEKELVGWAQKPTDFRPITLLNVDYKILTKILANRLRPLIAEHLKKNQFCGVPGNTILDALATVRDTIAMAEIKKTPMCLVSLDFQEAFDRISHTYLATILGSYCLSEWFVDRIRKMYVYEEAYSSVSINGHISGAIPIRCGIRQGCPLSMILFAVCIHPFLQILDRNLSGVQLQRTRQQQWLPTRMMLRFS